MKDWLKISALLCVFGFLRDLRPSEPYITDFLLDKRWRNITEDEINRYVYPVGTYSYLAQLVIVFLVTDFLRYKPLIVAMGVSGIIVWSMLLWTTYIQELQVEELFFGTYQATEIAYYTYIYAKVDKKYYTKVTSHTRAAMLIGRLIAGILAQLLITFQLMDYRELNYISLGTQIAATLWAMGLPSVRHSLYFHRKEDLPESPQNNTEETERTLANQPTSILWRHFKNAYTNVQVVKWSIWYALALCGNLQVVSYIQVLWIDIEPNPDIAWNGAVDATLTLGGAILAITAGFVRTDKFGPQRSLIVLSALSVLQGFALLSASWSYNLYVSYIGYIVFGSLFSFTITVASAEVARHLEEDSFGLVFGINTLIALILQTVIIIIVVSDTGFVLSVTNQFIVYAFYFIAIGALYSLSVVVEFFYFSVALKTNSTDQLEHAL